jgi:hypothetical protein
MKWHLKGKWLGHPLHPILAHVPMAMWLGLLLTKDHDQKTQIWWLPLIFAEEESEDRQA